MSHLFATALLLTLGAGSAGLLTTSSQPTLAQSFTPGSSHGGLVSADPAEAALASYLAQVEVPLTPAVSDSPAGGVVAEQTEGAIAATVCVNLPEWQRPSAIAQAKQLESMPRYGVEGAIDSNSASDNDPLDDLTKAWWAHEIFSFTTYGLSARTDPLYLSGVWTALEDTWDCYSGDQPEQINQGELAELWLLNHRLVSMAWQDSQYVVTVEPVGTGLQLVQFPRQESSQPLPLTIVTTTGQTLAVMSGDW